MLIFTPGVLTSIPLSELDRVQGRAYKVRCSWGSGTLRKPTSSIQIIIRTFAHPLGSRPILHAFSMAATLKGDFAESLNVGLHHTREA